MHEAALMRDLVSRIEVVAADAGGARVARVTVRLGALSHFSPDHFREHFRDASVGTVAEGAEVEAILSADVRDPDAQGVLLESIEVEPAESR